MREPSGHSGVYRMDQAREDREGRELLEALRRGDVDAFEQVATEQSPRLFRLALHLCGRPEDAEDLVQETLVRAMPALTRFEGRAKLSTYLIRSLTNLWKNRLRSRRRSRLVPWLGPRAAWENDGGPPDPPDPQPGADERLERLDRAARVREAVGRLEPVRRLTLLLREVEGLSYEEIAEMTRVPVGTVRSRLARARSDLRALLGGRP